MLYSRIEPGIVNLECNLILGSRTLSSAQRAQHARSFLRGAKSFRASRSLRARTPAIPVRSLSLPTDAVY